MILLVLLLPLLIANAELLHPQRQRSDCLNRLARQLFRADQTILIVYDEWAQSFARESPVDNPRIFWNVNDDILAGPRAAGEFDRRAYLLVVESASHLSRAIERLQRTVYWNDEISRTAIFLVVLNDVETDARSVIRHFADTQIYKSVVVRLANCEVYAATSTAIERDRVVDFFPFDFNDRNVIVEILPLFYPAPYIDGTCEPPRGLLIEPLHLWAEKYRARLTFDTTGNDLFTVDRPHEGRDYLYDSITNGTTDVCAVYPTRMVVGFRGSSTDSFIKVPHVWIVPKARKLSNGAVALRSFEAIVWYAVVASVLIASIARYALNRYATNATPLRCDAALVETIGLTVGYGTNRLPKSTVLRLWTVAYVLSAFNVSYVFQGKYSSYLTVPQYEARIADERQLARSDLTLIFPEFFKSLVLSWNDESAPLLRERVRFVNEPIQDLMRSSTGAEKLAHFMFSDSAMLKEYVNLDDKDYVISKIVQPMEPRYLLRYGSAYTESIDKIVVATREHGLSVRWSTDLRAARFVTDGGDDKRARRLTLEHVEFAFRLLACGCAIACGAFVVEVIMFKITLLKLSNCNTPKGRRLATSP